MQIYNLYMLITQLARCDDTLGEELIELCFKNPGNLNIEIRGKISREAFELLLKKMSKCYKNKKVYINILTSKNTTCAITQKKKKKKIIVKVIIFLIYLYLRLCKE